MLISVLSIVAGSNGSGEAPFLRSDGDLADPVFLGMAASILNETFISCCWISWKEAVLVGSRGASSVGVNDAAAFSSRLHRVAGRRVLAAWEKTFWDEEDDTVLEMSSLSIHAVESSFLSGTQQKRGNLEPSVVLQDFLHMRQGTYSHAPHFSTRLVAAVSAMCWNRCDSHQFNMTPNMNMTVRFLLYAFDQVLETASSNKIISAYCMQLRSQDYLNSCPVVLAAHRLEYQNWNNLLCVNSWSQDNITAADFLHFHVHTQQVGLKGRKNLGFGLQTGLNADVSTNLKFIFRSIMASTIGNHERLLIRCFSCICLSLSHDLYVEDAVSMLFGLCHRRWTTTPPLLIPRFNSGDVLSLSSVKVIRYLQLTSIPRVHIPDRPSGEPPAGHQLDRTFIEALEDCRCGNFESELSTDERTLYGSICDLQHLLHVFRSSSMCVVQLGTYLSCSTTESHVMMYFES